MPVDALDLQSRSTGGAAAAQPALAMLAAFASVAAERFDLTLTDATGGKVAFRSNRSLDELRATLPRILEVAARQRHNVIVRPRGCGPALIQLDDLAAAAESKLRPVSFLTIRTSPGSFQAWVAVADSDTDFARRLRKGAGADPSASGATRVSGSWNFKEKYTPAFPRVETVHTSPGRVVTRAELGALGVVARSEKAESTPAPARASRRSGRRGWPSYQRCVQGAPQARDGGRQGRSSNTAPQPRSRRPSAFGRRSRAPHWNKWSFLVETLPVVPAVPSVSGQRLVSLAFLKRRQAAGAKC